MPQVVTDAAGATAASTLTPSVTEVARPDSSTGEQGIPQRLAVTENEGGAVPVSLATLRLVVPSGVDPATVVVPGEATWLVDGAALAFTPESAFAGTRPWRCDGLSPPRGTRSNRQQRESDAQLDRKFRSL